MSLYNINNKLIHGSYGLITACETYTPPPAPPSFDEITLGTQTWTTKNLAIDDGGEGIVIVDNVTANGVNFGTQYYYTWDAAMRVVDSIQGWSLPTQDDWTTLVSYVGGANKLKSTSGWSEWNYKDGNGTDVYGFTVLPVGYIKGSNGHVSIGSWSYFWTPVINDPWAYYVGFLGGGWTKSTTDKTYNCSIRLIKD